MVKIPEEALAVLRDHAAVKVLSTVGPDGAPHSIVLGSTIAPSDEQIALGVVLMNETQKNLEEAKKKKTYVAVLASVGPKSYEVKAQAKEYQTSGPLFDAIKAELDKHKLPTRGVWVLEPAAVRNQSAGPSAGTKIA